MNYDNLEKSKILPYHSSIYHHTLIIIKSRSSLSQYTISNQIITPQQQHFTLLHSLHFPPWILVENHFSLPLAPSSPLLHSSPTLFHAKHFIPSVRKETSTTTYCNCISNQIEHFDRHRPRHSVANVIIPKKTTFTPMAFRKSGSANQHTRPST